MYDAATLERPGHYSELVFNAALTECAIRKPWHCSINISNE